MRGRHPKYREFIRTLRDILDVDTAALAVLLGKQRTNVSQYISGARKVGPGTLRSGLYRLGEWHVNVVQELEPIPKRLSSLPTTPGIYSLYDSSGSILYVGQATNLRTEIRQSLARQAHFPVRLGPQLSKKARPKYRDIATFLSAYEVGSPRLRHNLEALLLRVFPNQSHNNKLGNFQ